MQCDVFMFTAYKGVVLGPQASAGYPNRCVGVDSLAVGHCQEFAEKPLAPTENSEEPFFSAGSIISFAGTQIFSIATSATPQAM